MPAPRLADVLTDIEDDPRLSQAQREAMRHALAADRDAKVEGLDAKLRPVLRASLGIPRRESRYALLRNGDPTDVTGSIKEQWSRTR